MIVAMRNARSECPLAVEEASMIFAGRLGLEATGRPKGSCRGGSVGVERLLFDY